MAIITGTKKSEKLVGTDVKDTFSSLVGDDTVIAGGGNDGIFGGLGSEKIYGGAGDDRIQDDFDKDFTGQRGDDLIFGGAGDDVVEVYGGSDTIYGGAGDDVLSMLIDSDDSAPISTWHTMFYGGAGSDEINLLFLGGIAFQGQSGAANQSKFSIDYGRGDDFAYFSKYADLFTMVSLKGGAGRDGITISLKGVSEDGQDGYAMQRVITVRFLEDGSIKLTGIKGKITGFESVELEGLRDHQFGIRFYDGKGGHRLEGTAVADVIDSGGGDDLVEAGRGNDTLIAATGDDYLYGGEGADTFVIRRFNFAEKETFIGFAGSEGDVIRLGGVAKGDLTTETLADAFVLGTEAADADDRLIYDATTGRVYLDVDGTGEAAKRLLFVVDDSITLTASDFVLA